MQMTVLIFITGIFQDDIDDGLSGNLFSLRVVSEKDFALFIPPRNFFFPLNKILDKNYHLGDEYISGQFAFNTHEILLNSFQIH